MSYMLYADCGKDALKSLFDAKNLYIKNRVYVGDEAPSGCYLVKYDGISYVVGDTANASPNYDTSKAIIEHKILCYLAMALMVPNHSHVHLVTGMPVQLWADRETRLRSIEYYKSEDTNGKVNITVDGIESTYSIDNVTILAESSGYVYSRADRYENALVGVLDIGGLNTNGAIYDGLNIIKSSTFSINYGASILRTEVKDAIRSKLGHNIQDYMIEHLMKKPTPEMVPVIREVKLNFMRKIIIEMKAHNWELNLLDICATGGGSNLMHEVIREVFPEVSISSDSLWDNVRGWKTLMEAMA